MYVCASRLSKPPDSPVTYSFVEVRSGATVLHVFLKRSTPGITLRVMMLFAISHCRVWWLTSVTVLDNMLRYARCLQADTSRHTH